MTTKLYGYSDDTIQIDGDFEMSDDCFPNPDRVATFSDGTVARIRFAPTGTAQWKIELITQGPLFDRLEQATDEEENYTDILHLKDGITGAILERVPGQ